MAVLPFKHPGGTAQPAPDTSARTPVQRQNERVQNDGLFGDMEIDATDLLLNAMKRSGIKNFFVDVEIPMQRHLASLTGLVKESNIEEWRRKLCREKDDELRSIAEKSNKHDWSARPAYFHALLALIIERKMSGGDVEGDK